MVKVLDVGPLTIVTRPPRSPLFKTVAPFFQVKVIGPGPEAVVLNVAVPPEHRVWSAGSDVVFAWIAIEAVTVWLSAVTSTFAVPVLAPAVNVADAAPSTKFALAPVTLPNAGVAFVNVAGKGGRPFSSTVKGSPTCRCLMSAEMVEVPPEQMEFGLELARNFRKSATVTVPLELRKLFAPGPLLMPHQLSSAANVPELWKIVRPFVAVGTVFPTRREYLTLPTVPAARIAPPEIAALLFANELVVTVSGPPLSTMIAPPLPPVAWLLLKLEVLTV